VEYRDRHASNLSGVTNVITVKPKVEPSDLQREIMEALKRNAEVDANRIAVETNGSEVILKGTVRSWIEREEAERVAWSAPGAFEITHLIEGAWSWRRQLASISEPPTPVWP
jgi:osmotically-inducible protein OsmY